ncbi:PITH domain-containing protein 1 [Bienertia sinuspersici]
MACLHEHSCEDHDCSSNWSLYKHIDLPKVFFNFSVSALNEAVAGSAKSVFRSWEQRLNSAGVSTNSIFLYQFLTLTARLAFLESNDGDPELIVFIP